MGYADYTRGTGSGGIMLIRVADAAGYNDGVTVIGPNDVHYWIQAGQTATNTGVPGFGWKAYYNGYWPPGGPAQSGNITNYPTGRPWRYVTGFNISTTQTIRFHIDASGTQGFGGPTDFDLTINRATVPPQTSPLDLTLITHTSMRYRFSGNGDGGSAITGWQAHYGPSPSLGGPGNITVASTGTTDVTNLQPATSYYFWSNGKNAVGEGAWSTRLDAKTLSGAKLRVNGAWVDAVPYVKVAGVWVPAITYQKVGGIWVPTTS